MYTKICLSYFLQNRLHHFRGRHEFSEENHQLLLAGDGEQQKKYLIGQIGSLKLERWQAYFAHQIDLGIQFAYPGHDNYPLLFRFIENAPFLFSYIGKPVWNLLPCLGVVGSREMSALSNDWMDLHLAEWLKKSNAVLVSGGARGVDQKAHEICLRLQMPTLVVVPSGLGELYPRTLKNWVDEVVRHGGAFISEYSYGQSIRKHFFQARNRLISGLSLATLIVQAERRSGTLITARQSLEQGRPVLVIPSHPMDILHQGGLDLLTEGAVPVRDASDLANLFDSEAMRFQL